MQQWYNQSLHSYPSSYWGGAFLPSGTTVMCFPKCPSPAFPGWMHFPQSVIVCSTLLSLNTRLVVSRLSHLVNAPTPPFRSIDSVNLACACLAAKGICGIALLGEVQLSHICLYAPGCLQTGFQYWKVTCVYCAGTVPTCCHPNSSALRWCCCSLWSELQALSVGIPSRSPKLVNKAARY